MSIDNFFIIKQDYYYFIGEELESSENYNNNNLPNYTLLAKQIAFWKIVNIDLILNNSFRDYYSVLSIINTLNHIAHKHYYTKLNEIESLVDYHFNKPLLIKEINKQKRIERIINIAYEFYSKIPINMRMFTYMPKDWINNRDKMTELFETTKNDYMDNENNPMFNYNKYLVSQLNEF